MNCNLDVRKVFVGAPLMLVLSLSEEYLMSNTKAQSSNEIQSPKDKIKGEKSSCPELVERLTFSYLTFI